MASQTMQHLPWWRASAAGRKLPGLFLSPGQVAAKQLSKAAVVWVNHLPARLDLLVGDGSTVTFPDGYEDVLCLEWGALALLKGGASPRPEPMWM